MRTTISIFLCKMISWACKILKPIFKKEGSVLPGEVVNRIQKNVLYNLKYPSSVVVVTGSSGKGSSVAMIAHILENSGKKVVWNKSGSNVRTAIITLVLSNTKVFSHKVDADVLLLEMDERYIINTFKPGTISHMVITNITRDQPSRNAHPEIIFDKIMESIDEHMHLIINADDPIVSKARFMHGGEITTFGVGKTSCDEEGEPEYAVDAAYCPSCQTKLKYASYHYGHIGLYDCPNCSFGRGHVDYEATEVDLKKGNFKISESTLKLNKNAFFAVYYTLVAYTVCRLLNLKDEEILKEINDDSMSSKRGKSYELDGRKMEMLESKNENALSYLQSIDYIVNADGKKKTVIMGFENVSRRYRFNDLSWLWDVPFEKLNVKEIDKIFLIGRFKYDVATRLDYAGFAKDKIVLVEDMANLLDEVVTESAGDIYTMVCFDMTGIITKLLKERSDEKDN